MATPTMITVYGQIQNPVGTGDGSARVVMEQQVWLTHSDGTAIEPQKYIGVADGTGGVSFQVPATNDPSWLPQNWTYRVTLDGMENTEWSKPFRAAVPYNSSAGNLSLGELVPVGQASDGVIYAPANHTHGQYSVTGHTHTTLNSGFTISDQFSMTAPYAGMDWGPSGGPKDVNLYRGDVGVLRTDSQLQVGGNLRVENTLVVTPGAVLELGVDTNLYRAGVNKLGTDDALDVSGQLHSYAGLSTDGTLSAGGYRVLTDQRVMESGELVLRRRDVNTELGALTDTLYVTHFTALRTETILTLQTNTAGTAGVGATHAWVGILQWTGTEYVPVAVSVDDPTRWAATFAPYNTPLFATTPGTGLANLSSPGFNKVAGQRYASWILWIGGGQAPLLPAARVNYADSLTEPRENGYMALSNPPSSNLQAAWLAGVDRAFQAHLKP